MTAATPKMTKTQRIAKERLSYFLWLSDQEDTVSRRMQALIPQAWHRLEHDLDVVEKKVPVTLRLDASVAKFYRAMGHGYQARINRILATYAQMRISDAVRVEEEMLTFITQAASSRYSEPPDDIEPGPGET